MIFCTQPALIALNDHEEWLERAVALGSLIEQGDVEAAVKLFHASLTYCLC